MEPLPRRSMSQALRTVELPTEALDLIRAGTPQPVTNRPSVVPPKVEPSAPSTERKATIASTLADDTEPAPEEEVTKTARSRVKETEASGLIVTASFRLPAEIPNALLRASVDRKIKKLKPWTQQEIVAEALTQWLKRNGYFYAA